jgi:subtilisin family serine protease
MMATVTALGAFPVMSAGAAGQAGQTLRRAAPTTPAAVPGEIVVAFRSGVGGAERVAARSAADVRAKRHLLLPNAQLVKAEPGQSVPDAITALQKRSDVRYAEPNWIYHATSTTPNDPLFSSLWSLNNTGQAVNGHAAGTADADIDAPEAWDRSSGSASVVVAVVDTGVAWDHPDLAPNIWSNPGEIPGNGIDDDHNGKVDDVRGWDFVDSDNDPWDYHDHGTHVAGTIAARGNNGVGVTGVAWQASIMPVRVLDAAGSGTNANIADGLAYAASNGAKVVNGSFGGPDFSAAERDAITSHPNTLFVVAAGNDGANNDTTFEFPCDYTAANELCVAATDNTDALASFSNFGAQSVDLAAPGVDIESTKPHYTDSFSDDFETSLANKWTVQSGPWGRVSVLGSIWLTDSPGANYADNADWAIRTTSKVDVGARSDCGLRFSYATFLQQGFDWLYAQSSTDGTTWTDVAKLGDTGGSGPPAAATTASASPPTPASTTPASSSTTCASPARAAPTAAATISSRTAPRWPRRRSPALAPCCSRPSHPRPSPRSRRRCGTAATPTRR